MSYLKPGGYKYSGLKAGATGYKPFNGFLGSAVGFNPGLALNSAYNFSAAPADGSQIKLPYGKVYTFVWNGSPAPGVIPLVAGGGTAAQAAAAATLAMAAQSPGWSITNPSATQLVLLSPGGTAPAIVLVGVTNMSLLGPVNVAVRGTSPARFGKNYAFLSGS